MDEITFEKRTLSVNLTESERSILDGPSRSCDLENVGFVIGSLTLGRPVRLLISLLETRDAHAVH